LPKSKRTIDDLRRDGRMTEHEWAIIDAEVQRAIVGTAASLLKGKRKSA